jgi:hypothetical protein
LWQRSEREVTHREQKIIAAVPCPACGAGRGEPCQLSTEAELATARGRLLVHGARRTMWQEYRRRHPPDFFARPDGPRGGILTAQTERARTALLALVEGAVGSAFIVRVPDLRAAIDLLVADGWLVE